MTTIGPLGRPFPPVFDAVDRYSWEDDAEFQSGLQSILAPDVAAEQAEELRLKAQCFYFERKFDVPIDFEEYKAWRQYKASKATTNNAKAAPEKASESSPSSFANVPAANDTSISDKPSSEDANAETGGPRYPPSFAQVVELISTGKPIPGIKHIPGTVLEGQSSESTRPKRRKPWEKDEPPTSESASSLVAT